MVNTVVFEQDPQWVQGQDSETSPGLYHDRRHVVAVSMRNPASILVLAPVYPGFRAPDEAAHPWLCFPLGPRLSLLHCQFYHLLALLLGDFEQKMVNNKPDKSLPSSNWHALKKVRLRRLLRCLLMTFTQVCP